LVLNLFDEHVTEQHPVQSLRCENIHLKVILESLIDSYLLTIFQK